MSMDRNKDAPWNSLPNEWQYVHVRVLQDIRDELKAIKAVLQCSNTLRIPHTLEAIRKNTTKPKRKRRA